MKDELLISVIIPARNSEDTIEVAVQSILDQTWKNLEVIVVDDNSTDSTRAIVEKMSEKDARVKYYPLPSDDLHRTNGRGRNINAGYMARNYGFDKSRGSIIAFQDADDASLRNRIEIQYRLLERYAATHVCIDWQRLDPALIDKTFDADRFLKEHPEAIVGREEIFETSRRAKGIAMRILGSLRAKIPFSIKTMRVINRVFFGTLAKYPGAAGVPMLRREAMEIVKFRKLDERVWPSFTGRGADRDFNFQVAETFRNSYAFYIPLYLWRQDIRNPRAADCQKYLLS